MSSTDRKINLVKEMVEQWTPVAPVWVKLIVRLLINFPASRLTGLVIPKLRDRSTKEFLFVLYRNDALLSYLQLIKEIEEEQSNATARNS